VGATESPDAAALSKAGSRAARRRIAAQASFFDLANQKLLDEIREANIEKMTAEEARVFLTALRKKLM
ncbi:MAG: hypothetical protein ACXW18_13815, partial [Pyrinomonadaceae bacterium]